MKSKIAPGTSERLPWQILLFSLPLMASNVLQVLFNICLLYTSPSPRDA